MYQKFYRREKKEIKAAQFFIPLEKGEEKARLQTFTHA